MKQTNFLKKQLNKLTQEEIENPKGLLAIKMEFITKNLSKKGSEGPDNFTGNFYQIFNQKYYLTYPL